jgi:hypothetical protein
MPQTSISSPTHPDFGHAERGLRPESPASCTARSIRRDLLTLSGLPGLERVRSTYLSPGRPPMTPDSPAIPA